MDAVNSSSDRILASFPNLGMLLFTHARTLMNNVYMYVILAFICADGGISLVFDVFAY